MSFLAGRVTDCFYPHQANIKLEAYGFAISDASRAIELKPDYLKVCLCDGSWGVVGVVLIKFRKIGILSKSDSQYSHPQLARGSQRFQDRRQEGAE